MSIDNVSHVARVVARELIKTTEIATYFNDPTNMTAITALVGDTVLPPVVEVVGSDNNGGIGYLMYDYGLHKKLGEDPRFIEKLERILNDPADPPRAPSRMLFYKYGAYAAYVQSFNSRGTDPVYYSLGGIMSAAIIKGLGKQAELCAKIGNSVTGEEPAMVGGTSLGAVIKNQIACRVQVKDSAGKIMYQSPSQLLKPSFPKTFIIPVTEFLEADKYSFRLGVGQI